MIVLSGKSTLKASAWLTPCTPQPSTPMTEDSGRARRRAAMALAAPVRLAVIQTQSMTASGRPVAVSFRIKQAGDVGQAALVVLGDSR